MEAMTVVPSPTPPAASAPVPQPSRKALIDRLRKAIGALENIPKEGWNEHSQYRYVRVDTIAASVRRALSEAGLVLIGDVVERKTTAVQTSGGKAAWSEDVTLRFTLTDGEGEITFSMPGSGQDTGDKALYKAISGARKYALLTLLNLGGDDPEVDSPETRKPSQPADGKPTFAPPPLPVPPSTAAPAKATERQLKAMRSLAKALLMDEAFLAQVAKKHFGTDSLEGLGRAQASKILDMLKNEQARALTAGAGG